MDDLIGCTGTRFLGRLSGCIGRGGVPVVFRGTIGYTELVVGPKIQRDALVDDGGAVSRETQRHDFGHTHRPCKRTVVAQPQ